MGTQHPLLVGSPAQFRSILAIIFGTFVASAGALLVLNARPIELVFAVFFGVTKTFFLQLYFWGMLGATLASYKFAAKDKDDLEVAALQEEQDPIALRYPNSYDVCMYLLRILFGGVLGVIAAGLFLAGLGYFEAQPSFSTEKQRVFFVVLAFLVGIHEKNFLGFLASLNGRLLKSDPKDSGSRETELTVYPAARASTKGRPRRGSPARVRKRSFRGRPVRGRRLPGRSRR